MLRHLSLPTSKTDNSMGGPAATCAHGCATHKVFMESMNHRVYMSTLNTEVHSRTSLDLFVKRLRTIHTYSADVLSTHAQTHLVITLKMVASGAPL